MRVPAIEFYFDYLSPYAYLAWVRLQEVSAKRQLPLAPHPILFAGLLNHFGHRGPAEIPAKLAYVHRDACRFARVYGVECVGPKYHPFHPLTALRVSLPEVAGEQQSRVIDALFRAGWANGIDLGSPVDIRDALDRAGLPGAELVARTDDPAVKNALKAGTDRAIAKGIFGVPTMIAGDELFWGNDRIEFMEMYLDGKDPLDHELVAKLGSKPRAVDRKQVR